MAIDVSCAYLLLRAAQQDARKLLAAQYFVEAMSARVDAAAARVLHGEPAALDTLVREELGLDPDELGNPWRAALGSFLAFGAGAVVPVAPFVFGGGTAVFVASIGLSLLAMFVVGVGVSLLTGRSALFSGVRQVAIGVAAATVTFAVGRAIGVSVS